MCAGVVVSVVLTVTACTGGGEPEDSTAAPDAANTSTQPSPSPSTPEATTADAQPKYVEPLVLAFAMQRLPLHLTERQAREIMEGGVSRWGELDRAGGAIVVRRGPAAVDAAASRPDVLAVVPASRMTPTVQAAKVGGVDPLAQPRRYPISVASAQGLPSVTTVTVAGDIMLGRRVATEAPGGSATTLRPLSRRLAAADLTIGNLESTLSDDGFPSQGDDSFAADPSVLSALDDAGFDLLSLANNHTGDYGEQALRQTLHAIDASPIRSVGAGRNANEAWRPVVLTADGVSVGFVAFNAIGETPRATRSRPGAAEIRMQPRTGPLDRSDLTRTSGIVQALSARTDITIVLPHWGDQYTNQPVADQRIVGAALVEAGADLVVGGHPHWVQGVQLHRGRVIAHSLGNFVFDMDFSRQTQEGALLELVFWGDRLRGMRLAPYVIGGDFAPRLVHGARARSILDLVWEASDPPLRD